MAYKAFDELHGRNRFLDIDTVFVTIVMESDIFTVIFVNYSLNYPEQYVVELRDTLNGKYGMR